MNTDVQAFVDKWAEKTAAKQDVLDALGQAKAYEAQGIDASGEWAIVEKRGINGDEGRLYEEAVAIAEAYVTAHPEQFVMFEDLVASERHGDLVEVMSALRERRREEEVAKLTMFELVRFERQHIGQAMQVVTRRTNGR